MDHLHVTFTAANLRQLSQDSLAILQLKSMTKTQLLFFQGALIWEIISVNGCTIIQTKSHLNFLREKKIIPRNRNRFVALFVDISLWLHILTHFYDW